MRGAERDATALGVFGDVITVMVPASMLGDLTGSVREVAGVRRIAPPPIEARTGRLVFMGYDLGEWSVQDVEYRYTRSGLGRDHCVVTLLRMSEPGESNIPRGAG